ncbi:MAG: MBL fold metallo-hydrolase [Geminicoccaceae bacterium]
MSIHIHGCHEDIEAALRIQHRAPHFPVDFSELAADIHFHRLEEGKSASIAGFEVTPKAQAHPGRSFGYRIQANGRTTIYSTDSEHKRGSAAELEEFACFFARADLVIFDAMYSLADAISDRLDWGHSSNLVGVDLCMLADARRLCLFHHDPATDDEGLARILADTRRYARLAGNENALEVISAHDGLVLDL